MPATLVYQNPVWPDYFADPFVLQTKDGYYAYGTGPIGPDGRQFPILGRMARALRRCSFDNMHGGRDVVVYNMGCETVPTEGEVGR